MFLTGARDRRGPGFPSTASGNDDPRFPCCIVTPLSGVTKGGMTSLLMSAKSETECVIGTQMRVLYGDTDAMGQAYYGNYLRWFEHGRSEWFRACGMSYRGLEEKGVFLP